MLEIASRNGARNSPRPRRSGRIVLIVSPKDVKKLKEAATASPINQGVVTLGSLAASSQGSGAEHPVNSKEFEMDRLPPINLGSQARVRMAPAIWYLTLWDGQRIISRNCWQAKRFPSDRTVIS